MKKSLCLVLWLLITFQNFAHSLPSTQSTPGGIVTLPISAPSKPTVLYQDKPVLVIPEQAEKNLWLAIVGIPLDTPPGEQSIKITSPLSREITFTVNAKKYPEEQLTISDESKIKPGEALQKRIAKERETIKKAFAHFSDANPLKKTFIPPVHGRISSPFGMQRLYNDKLQSRHTGVDIVANLGTPIKAPAAGVVLLTGDYFYTGNTVILDHGQGLITLYAHMDRIDVSPGQYVAQGKTLGTVGVTGRVTGAHLHWGVILNQTQVDPLLFADQHAITTLPNTDKKA